MDKKTERELTEYYRELFDRDCVLSNEKYEKFKKCWEYATEIVEYNNQYNPFNYKMELSFEADGGWARIFIVENDREIATTSNMREKWNYMFTNCDQVAASTYNLENPLDDRIKFVFSFNTQWIDPK